MNKIFITICLALVALAANAQTITDELRRDLKGYGRVVINQSQDIERLVNNTPQATAKPVTTTPQTSTTTTTTTGTPSDAQTTPEQPAAPKEEKPMVTPPHPTVSPSATPEENASATVNTNKKIMRHSYKTTGYRIQVYSGGNKREDRQKCEQISARLKASFPNLPIYVHFYSPSWKCRAGNYTDQAEAQAMLKQIKAMGYSQACLVKGTINVQY